jgi:hypothetical protein
MKSFKKTTLLVVGVIALLCSRFVFFLINDPEGPNLVVVVGLGIIIYAIFLAVHFLIQKLNK